MSAQVAADLRAAAAIIRRGGLCKGEYESGEARCAEGALGTAISGFAGRWSWRLSQAAFATEAVVGVARGTLPSWNDAPERTAADVTCAMEAAATRANPPVLHAGAGLALTRLRGGR